jgi:hypothetical protein
MDASVRDSVRRRASGHCEYCHLPQSAVPSAPFQIEHIVARQHFGSDDASNLALACDRCNLHKGPNLASVDPESGETVLLYHPRRDTWNDHFRIEEGRISGKTPTGRATVRLLQMNSERRCQLRRDFKRLGLS